MPVRNRVAEIRLERGISQVQFGKELEVTRQTINAIETGKYNPSLELALKILRYFGLPLDEVFVLEEGESK